MAKLLIAGFALLTLAWVFTNPPGAGPDEAANYIKAVGAGQGDLLGVKDGPTPAQATVTVTTNPPLRAEWANSTTRWLRVPGSLLPLGFTVGDPTSPTQPSYVGTYQPFMYLLPGLATRLARDPITAVILARLVTALICLALIATAAWLLWLPGRAGLPLTGLTLAITPLVVFLAGVVSASGFEICAGICTVAAVIRLARPQAPTRAVFIAFASAGVVLALSRPLGVIWLGLDLGLLLFVVGPRRLLGIINTGGRAPRIGGLALLAAAALGLAWELTVDPHHHTSVAEIVYYLPRAVALLPLDLKQGIGIFGWLDTWMPAGAYFLWTATLVALLVVAVAVATRRQRLILGLLVLMTVGVALVVGAVIIMPIGGSALQARYFLAFAVTVPLYAGEVLAVNAHRLRRVKPAHLMGAATAVAAVLQGIALVINLAGFSGDLPDYARVFSPAGRWSPPLGSGIWLGVGLAGCALLLAAGATAFRKPRGAGAIATATTAAAA
ncbi:MAG: DUF2142 domain-containing protein [Candidatus Dormibacteraeota bacterium]|nr:DUF2142 domain-containing protein [Candidatus Dormibacteraeota bacterium]